MGLGSILKVAKLAGKTKGGTDMMSLLPNLLEMFGVSATGAGMIKDTLDKLKGPKGKVDLPPPPAPPDFGSRFSDLMNSQNQVSNNIQSNVSSIPKELGDIRKRGSLQEIVTPPKVPDKIESNLDGDNVKLVDEINTNTYNQVNSVNKGLNDKLDLIIGSMDMNNSIDNQSDATSMQGISQLNGNDITILNAMDSINKKMTEDATYTTNVLSERMDYNNALSMNQVLALQSIMAGNESESKSRSDGIIKKVLGGVKSFLDGSRVKQVKQMLMDKAYELGSITGLVVTAVDLLKDIVEGLWEKYGTSLKIELSNALNTIPGVNVDLTGGPAESVEDYNKKVKDRTDYIKGKTASKYMGMTGELRFLETLASKKNYNRLVSIFGPELLSSTGIFPGDISKFALKFSELRDTKNNKWIVIDKILGYGASDKLKKLTESMKEDLKTTSAKDIGYRINSEYEKLLELKESGNPEYTALSNEQLKTMAGDSVLKGKKYEDAVMDNIKSSDYADLATGIDFSAKKVAKIIQNEGNEIGEYINTAGELAKDVEGVKSSRTKQIGSLNSSLIKRSGLSRDQSSLDSKEYKDCEYDENGILKSGRLIQNGKSTQVKIDHKGGIGGIGATELMFQDPTNPRGDPLSLDAYSYMIKEAINEGLISYYIKKTGLGNTYKDYSLIDSATDKSIGSLANSDVMKLVSNLNKTLLDALGGNSAVTVDSIREDSEAISEANRTNAISDSRQSIDSAISSDQGGAKTKIVTILESLKSKSQPTNAGKSINTVDDFKDTPAAKAYFSTVQSVYSNPANKKTESTETLTKLDLDELTRAISTLNKSNVSKADELDDQSAINTIKRLLLSNSEGMTDAISKAILTLKGDMQLTVTKSFEEYLRSGRGE